ncbi:SPOR domain-containing protein [Oceanisphaera arctica]|uniref:Sporulation protein n=1 Tax=Oceanisphaera arctica TaxID=641510 RepID=A0A2P5TJ23_9GAMM|nr:SPOR domain-containing protein [Oceanisphaera arctica]PPL14835.1 sporulation protein [Oceanisphaera arctica]GHA13309.1 cell division protein FtsN [Oceanisphaera arctica]
MPRDYVRRSKPKSKGKSNSRPARGGSRSRAPQRRVPWLAIILVLLLAAALGYLLSIIKGAAGNRSPEAPPAVTHTQAPPTPVNPIDQKPVEKWRYIEQLENKEVVVTVPEAEESTQPYLMQCGSFRSSAQAEQLKAKIAFQGLVAQVRHKSGSSWYRVILGPYDSKRLAEQHKHKLIKAKAVGDCAIWFWEG